MKLAYMLHDVQTKDGTYSPKTVVMLSDELFDELLPFGAIRPANDAEQSIYGQINPVKQFDTARADMIAKADALGLKYRKNISDEALAALLAESE